MESAPSSRSEGRARLERLEGYLRQDPHNSSLLVEAFDAALQAGEWDRAGFHLRHAQALGLARHEWLLREAHWSLAQHRWPAAREVLTALRAEVPTGTALATNIVADLAYTELREGSPARGVSILEPIADAPGGGGEVDTHVQMLWLRLLHRSLDPERAMAWICEREESRTLYPGVAGVASLVALDLGDYPRSLRWSSAALQVADPVIEARVARASLALGERDAALALDLLTPALIHHGEDGRVWSALGFAHLLDEDSSAAREAFEHAVRLLSDHIGTWHGLGWTAIAQSDLATARRAFEAALSLDRNFAENHGAIAVVAAMRGDREGARDAIDVALRLDRTSLSARYAEALVAGEVRDSVSLRRLADRILGDRRAPLGSNLTDLLRRPRAR